jgi:hypothetical protein
LVNTNESDAQSMPSAVADLRQKQRPRQSSIEFLKTPQVLGAALTTLADFRRPGTRALGNAFSASNAASCGGDRDER